MMKKNFIKILLVCLLKSCVAAELYIFVSFSMPQDDIKAISKLAKKINGALVLRGLHQNSFKETALQIGEISKQTDWGMVIDPKLYQKLAVQRVPTFVLADVDYKGDIKKFDKLSGNVTLDYAMEEFSKKGDMAMDATRLLERLRGNDD